MAMREHGVVLKFMRVCLRRQGSSRRASWAMWRRNFWPEYAARTAALLAWASEGCRRVGAAQGHLLLGVP